jgi:hypothetical protein
MTKEIVIAAYDKNLSWMDKLNTDIKKTIYRKGINTNNPNEIFVEQNLGRCVHSFFNHIYINYDNLSDLTFFAQDYPFDHWENIVEVINDGVDKCNECAALKIGGYWGFHFNSLQAPKKIEVKDISDNIQALSVGTMWELSTSRQFDSGKVLVCESNGHPHDYNPRINVDKIWNLLFDYEKPNLYEFIPGGHFGILKEHAHIRSKEFYKKVVELLIEDTINPWNIERLECYFFNPKFKTKL